jgi:hypothetical protein
MMKTKGLIFSVLALVTSLFLTGCQDFENGQPGRLVVKITDAPFPIDLVEEANVTITKLELRTEVDTAGYPFLTIFEGSREFNLLELRNGVTEELVNLEVPAGEYNLMRLYVDNASIKVKDQEGSFDVKVPSGGETGIKLFIEPSLRVAGGLTEVLLDFNVDESFVLQGNINTPAGIQGFIFKPVIRAVNNASAGVVEGVVMDTDSVLLENAAVWIETDQDTITSYTDAQGYYAIAGILSGEYIMGAAMEGFDTVTVPDVKIIEGNLTVQDFMLEASATEE